MDSRFSNILVLIDNGHGIDTAGKRSPDGRLLEYSYTREIAVRVAEGLKELGVEAVRLVPEEKDITLMERCNRANAIHASTSKEVILVSIHCNAAGIGKDWLKANGWQVCIYPKASSKTKKLASCLASETEKLNLKVRRPMPGQDFWMQNLAICRDTTMPAVLTENLFMDNKAEVDYLLSEQGKETVAKLHINGIVAYINELLL